jgi:hypothetical protein
VSQVARVSPALAVVAALAMLAALLTVGGLLRPASAAGQGPAFEEQYELELDSGQSAPPAEPSPPQPAQPVPAAPQRTIERERGNQAAVAAAEPPEPPVRAAPETLSATASGQLPLGGYPMTPFVLLLLALLLGGLAVRVALAIRDRLRGRHSGPSAGAW